MEDLYGGAEVRADVDIDGIDLEEGNDLIVRLDRVHKTYLLGIEGVPALRGVSLSIKRGEFVVVFGLSGGGKTTLMNIIGTIDTPTKGHLELCGVKIDRNTHDTTLSNIRLRNLGFVFQTFNLLGSLTALENVMLPMILAGDLTKAERKSRATRLLESVGLGNRVDHVPSQLSGGEQQRVTIARAVANSPDLLLLDEPTGDLDSYNTCLVMQQLITLNENDGITLVMVTHDVSLKNFAHRVIWMQDGKIQHVEEISPKQRKKRKAELGRDVSKLKEGKQSKIVEFSNTFILRPTDYPTDANHIKSEPKKFVFHQDYIAGVSPIQLQDSSDSEEVY